MSSNDDGFSYLRDKLDRCEQLSEGLREENDLLRDFIMRFQQEADTVIPRTKYDPYAGLRGSTIPLARLHLSGMSFNALKRHGITTVGDVTQYSDRELLNIYSFGHKGLRSLRAALDDLALTPEEGNQVQEVL